MRPRVDQLGPHRPHEVGEPLRRHQGYHCLEDGPLLLDLGIGVGEVVAQGRGSVASQVDDLDGHLLLVGGNPELELAAGAQGQYLLRPGLLLSWDHHNVSERIGSRSEREPDAEPERVLEFPEHVGHIERDLRIGRADHSTTAE